jgi:hypothetical protein
MPTLILPSGRVDGHLAQRGHETTGLATRGTDGSNPPPSKRESIANLTPADAERPGRSFCREG